MMLSQKRKTKALIGLRGCAGWSASFFANIRRQVFSRCGPYVNGGHIIWVCSTSSNTQMGAQWLSGRVLDSRPKGRGFEAHPASLCCGPLARHIYPSLVLVQPRKIRPYITERLLMRRRESNQTN